MSFPATTTLPQPLRGIVPPMITPLRARDDLDVPGAERLIEHIRLHLESGWPPHCACHGQQRVCD